MICEIAILEAQMQKDLHGSAKSIHRWQLQISIMPEVDVCELSTVS